MSLLDDKINDYVQRHVAELSDTEQDAYRRAEAYTREMRREAEALIPPDLWQTPGCHFRAATAPGQRPRWELSAPRQNYTFEIIVRCDDSATCSLQIPASAWPNVPGPQPPRTVAATREAIEEAVVSLLGDLEVARQLQARAGA